MAKAPKNVKYTCTYCGVAEIDKYTPAWLSKDRRCKTCNHNKFKTKEYPEGAGNVFGYEEDEPEKQGASIMSDFFGGLDYDD